MKGPFTVGDDSRASNPGNARLKPMVWLRHKPKWGVILGSLVILSVLCIFYLSPWFVMLAALLLRINIFYWLRQKEHFKLGDSNGGIVVATNPVLVAVTTDLTKGFGEYPVVKIISCSPLKSVHIGQRIPTVALYTASEDDTLNHWIDFNPVPLQYATDSKKTLERALNSYDPEQWVDLEKRLTEIKKPYQTGLYKVELETSDWKSSKYFEEI